MEETIDISTKEGMEAAIQWQTNLCNYCAEGASWGVPRSSAIYQIYKSRKTVVRATNVGDDAVEQVFLAMGWSVRGEL